MTAATIIQRIRAAGGAISLADDRLKLSIPKSLSDELMPEIRAGKDAIQRALRNEASVPWDATDYRTFFVERAAIAEFDGGLSRDDAEAQAREDVIDEWLDRHRPTPSGSRHCAGCGGEIPRPGEDGVPHHAGDAGAVWLHHECWEPWMARRREEARRALAELGVAEMAG